jgi:hypothetical protein
MALASCNPAAKFAVVDVGGPSMMGLRSVHGTATVVSEARRDLTIESAVVTVAYRQTELVSARLMRPITIAAGGETRVRYDMALENTSLARLQTLMSRISIEPSGVSADIEAWVRYGAFRRKIELNDVPESEIFSIFAPR